MLVVMVMVLIASSWVMPPKAEVGRPALVRGWPKPPVRGALAASLYIKTPGGRECFVMSSMFAAYGAVLWEVSQEQEGQGLSLVEGDAATEAEEVAEDCDIKEDMVSMSLGRVRWGKLILHG